MISIDETLFTGSSGDALARQQAYAKNLERLDVLVLCGQEHADIVEDNLRVRCAAAPTRVGRLFAAWRMIRDYDVSDFDVVSSQDPFVLGLLGWRAAARVDASFRPQLHGECFSNPGWQRLSLFNRFSVLIGRVVVRRADRVRVVSPRERDLLAARDLDAVHIPVAADTAGFAARVDRKRDIDVLFVGRLEPVKNPSALLELESLLPDARIVAVGDGSLRSSLSSRAGRVEFVGRVSHEKVKQFMARSKVLVLPSISEGWGVVAVEASSAGCAVVMSATGLAGSVVVDGQSGAVCASSEPECFAQRISSYLRDESLRREHVQAARARAEDFSSEQLISQFSSFLS